MALTAEDRPGRAAADFARVRLRATRLERSDWNALAPSFEDHNYRQSWEYGVRAAARVGAVCEALALRDGANAAAAALVRVRRIPLLGGIAYVSGGPLVRRDGARDVGRLVDAALALREEYAVRRGLVLRIAPPIGPTSWNDDARDALVAAGFAPVESARVYRTLLLPLTPTLPEIRRRLHQKWRNCLNRAEREGLIVRSAHDAAALEEFRGLFDRFVERKRFAVDLGADFYATVQRGLPDEERFAVHLAERDGKVVAGHVSSALGDTAVYLLGATSPDALTCKAAYLLHWRAVEVARARGCSVYDLGGTDPDGNPGVHHFKEGMGGAEVFAAPVVQTQGGGAGVRVVLAIEARYRSLRAVRGATG